MTFVQLSTTAMIAMSTLLAACSRETQTEAAQATRDVGEATARATGVVAEKAKDAMITAAVNGALAADASLSALRIDVDTTDGRVVLKGSAPDAAARDRATQLARGIDGVLTVDNRLTVNPNR